MVRGSPRGHRRNSMSRSPPVSSRRVDGRSLVSRAPSAWARRPWRPCSVNTESPCSMPTPRCTDLYEGEAVPLVEAAFPGTTKDGRVDRDAHCSRYLPERPEDFRRLEAIVHPLVKRAETAFAPRRSQARRRHRGAGNSAAVRDWPRRESRSTVVVSRGSGRRPARARARHGPE